MAGTSATPFYVAAKAPNDAAYLPGYITAELQKVQRAIQLLALGHVDTTYVEPEKPREGDIRLADGTHWDPVSAGAPRFVGYRDGGWVLLG